MISVQEAVTGVAWPGNRCPAEVMRIAAAESMAPPIKPNQKDLNLWAAVDYLLHSPHNEHTLHGELTSVTVSAHAWEQLRLAFEAQKASL